MRSPTCRARDPQPERPVEHLPRQGRLLARPRHHGCEGQRRTGPSPRQAQGRRRLRRVVEAVEELEREQRGNRARSPQQVATVADWLTYWLRTSSAQHPYKTYEGYKGDIRNHLHPADRRAKMAKIQHEPERFERCTSSSQNGLGQYTVHHVHITVRAAFREARSARSSPRTRSKSSRLPGSTRRK